MEAVAKDVERFCIFENDLPCSGGRWPEYAATMILCFDQWENDMAIGSLRTFLNLPRFHFTGWITCFLSWMHDGSGGAANALDGEAAHQGAGKAALRQKNSDPKPLVIQARPAVHGIRPDLYPSARYHAGSAACGRQSRGMFSQWPGTAVSPAGNYKSSI